MISGLQADTFLEASEIIRNKESYDNMMNNDSDTTALVESIAKETDPYGRLAASIGEYVRMTLSSCLYDCLLLFYFFSK